MTAPTGRHDAVHVKPLPVTSEVRGRLKVVPEQTGEGCVLVRCGVGFTVTVKSDTGPLHPLAWGVIWYVTVANAEVVLISKSLIVVTWVLCMAVNPVTAPTGRQDAVQVKSPPATSGISVSLKVVAEQMGAGAVLVKCGVGLTVTVKSESGPTQPLACGVI